MVEIETTLTIGVPWLGVEALLGCCKGVVRFAFQNSMYMAHVANDGCIAKVSMFKKSMESKLWKQNAG